jgi:tetratricopeptide (TPR) repeat protein
MNANSPSTGRPRTHIIPKDQQRFALFLGGAALVATLVIAGRHPAEVGAAPAFEKIRREARGWHRTHAVHRLEQACRDKDCACIVTAAKVGLDVDAGRSVRELLDGAKTCRDEREFAGLHAEALVRAGDLEQGQAEAQAAVAGSPGQPHALMALALLAYRAGNNGTALTNAAQALTQGRGDGAHLLVGLIHFVTGDLAGARASFAAILASEPTDVAALYNLALVAQKEDHYGEARKLFLTVLYESPKHKEARYYLAVLAHSVGADAEAQHHLEKLSADAPGDPLLRDLKRVLATPPAHPPGQVLSLGSPAASAVKAR